jgi:hypothetical protein
MRDLRKLGVLMLGLAAALPSGAYAGGIPGTKERITFEGLVGRHEMKSPGDYDGFGWAGSLLAIGKGLYKDQQGFQAVVHQRAGAAYLVGTGDRGIIVRDDSSLFSIESGHFAAFGNISGEAIFNGYRQGVLVARLDLTLQPADTLVKFDKSFAHIDKLVIEGQSVAMDDLHVSF